MTVSDGVRVDSTEILDYIEHQEDGCFPCCSNYQIRASKYENEFMIETDDVSIGHVKIYPRGGTCSAFIMDMNQEILLAINVHSIFPKTASFFTPSTSAEYDCKGDLHLEAEDDRRSFTFNNRLQTGTLRGSVQIRTLGSSCKFQLLANAEPCGHFTFNTKNINISGAQVTSFFDVLLMLGIAISACYMLPFKE
jgi:hypothetical protein